MIEVDAEDKCGAKVEKPEWDGRRGVYCAWAANCG